jgi:CRISPR/Cas system-associated exonuclease Cas4 (RecB family)
MIMEDLRAAIDQAKAKKIRVSPVHANRAGELGHPCLRYLVYMRTRWQEQIPITIDTQYLFDQGNVIERAAIRDLEEAGIEVSQSAKDLYWKALNISGRIDGRIRWEGGFPVIEIKGINPFDFPKLNTVADFHNSKKLWLRKYPGQLTIYLVLENEEWGIFILKDKVSGKIKPIRLDLDYAYAETLLKKAEAVEKHVREGTLPDRIGDESAHQYCHFNHICLPGQVNTDKFIEDPELEAKIDRWFELKGALKPMEKDFKEIDEYLKTRFKDIPQAVVGDWLIEGKLAERKGWVVQPFSFWDMKIKSLIRVQKVEAED